MASINFDVSAIEELERMLLHNAEAAEKHVEPMLKAGAEIISAEHNAALEKIANGGHSTGDIAGSVKPGKVRELSMGAGYGIQVFPHGKQTHGVPRAGQRGLVENTQVGFILEYGTSDMEATPWRDNANAAAEPKVQEKMAEMWKKVSYGD